MAFNLKHGLLTVCAALAAFTVAAEGTACAVCNASHASLQLGRVREGPAGLELMQVLQQVSRTAPPGAVLAELEGEDSFIGGRRRRRRRRRFLKSVTRTASTATSAVKNTASSATNAVSQAGQAAVSGAVGAGQAVGSGVGNAGQAVHIGVTKTIPQGLKTAARQVGSGTLTLAKPIAAAARDVRRTAAKVVRVAVSSVDLDKLGKGIANNAKRFGPAIAKVGPIAAGLGQAAWDALKDLVSCLDLDSMMCEFLLGSVCDCAGGSRVSMRTSPLALGATCVLGGGAFGRSLSTSTSAGRSFLPGSSASGPKQGALSSGRRSSTKPAMRAKLAKAPAGSCDAELMLALEGNLEWSPTIALDVDVSKGLVTVKVDAEVTADMSALISAEAQCSAGLTRRLPSKPLKEMACAGYFCLLIMLQGVAKINVAGSVAGSAELGLIADFGMSAEVQVGIASGEADVKASSTKLRHQVGWQVAGSFDASVDVSMGPQLVVFPLPGVPVTIMPTISAAVVAYGTVKYPNFVDALAVQHADEQTCAGAEVSVSGNADISGVGLPADLRLDTKEFEELLMGAVEDGAAKLLSLMAGGECSGPVGRAAQRAVGAAAELAGGAIGAAIPDLSVGLNVPVKSFLDQDLFCLKLARVGDCDALACP